MKKTYKQNPTELKDAMKEVIIFFSKNDVITNGDNNFHICNSCI